MEPVPLLKTSRRQDVSILSLNVRFSADHFSHLEPYQIQTGLELFREGFLHVIKSAGGTVVADGGQDFMAVFGAEPAYRDHAARATQAAIEMAVWAGQQRRKGASLGLELPHYGQGIHSGEAILLPLNEVIGSGIAVLGPAADLCQLLSRIARNDETLASEAIQRAVGKIPPRSVDACTGYIDDEPNLDGLDWETANFEPLPEDLRRKVVLFGPGVENDHSAAAFWFIYYYQIKREDSPAPVKVLGLHSSDDGFAPMLLSDAVSTGGVKDKRLGKYRLIEKIGSGGMGAVWKAQDGFGNLVALKVLLDPSTTDSSQTARLEREAKIMAQLQHRNICRIYEFGQYEDIKYIVMEYVGGITLNDLIASQAISRSPGGKTRPKTNNEENSPQLAFLISSIRSGRKKATSEDGRMELSDDHAAALMIKISEAVAFAHGKGILHRDLKPSNILVREDGEPLVADFGLAKFQAAGEASLSLSGQILGTLSYMAPEQAISTKTVDERADVYSLGAVLYYLLTGKKSFEPTGNIAADCQALQNHDPVRPRRLRPDLPVELESIILKALCANPTFRYRSALALRDDLDRYRRGKPVRAQPVSLGNTLGKLYERHRSAVLVAAGIFTLIAGVTSLSFMRINESRLDAEREKQNAITAREQAEERGQKLEKALAGAEENRKLAEEQRLVAEKARDERSQALGFAEEQRRAAEAALAKEKAAQSAHLVEQEKRLAGERARLEEEKKRLLAEEGQKKSAEEAAGQRRELAVAQKQILLGSSDSPTISVRESILPPGVSPEGFASQALSTAERTLTDLAEYPDWKPRMVTITLTGQEKFIDIRGQPKRRVWELGSLSRRGVLPAKVTAMLDQLVDSSSSATLAALQDPKAWLMQMRAALVLFNPSRARRCLEIARSLPDTDPEYLKNSEALLKALPDNDDTPEGELLGIIQKLQATKNVEDNRCATILQKLRDAVKFTFYGIPGTVTFLNYAPVLDISGRLAPKYLACDLIYHDPDLTFDFKVEYGRSPDSTAKNISKISLLGPGVKSLDFCVDLFAGRPVFAQETPELDISHSRITDLPALLPGVSFFTKLTATESNLEKVLSDPYSIFGRLTEINLSYSKLTDLKQFESLGTLQVLKINGCKIKTLDPLLNRRSGLQHLEIAECELASLKGMERLEKLHSLRFSPGLIKDASSIETLRKMPGLQFIATEKEGRLIPASSFWLAYDAAGKAGAEATGDPAL